MDVAVQSAGGGGKRLVLEDVGEAEGAGAKGHVATHVARRMERHLCVQANALHAPRKCRVSVTSSPNIQGKRGQPLLMSVCFPTNDPILDLRNVACSVLSGRVQKGVESYSIVG